MMRTDKVTLPKRIPFKYWDPRDEILMPRNQTIHMVERSTWKPTYPKYRLKSKKPVEYVILRFTGSDPCTDYESGKQRVRELQKSQIDTQGYEDIMWSFLIGPGKFVYEGTGWKYTTSKIEEHFWDIEFNNMDIAYIGRSMDDVTPEMRWTVRKLIEISLMSMQLTFDFEFRGEEDAIKTLPGY